MRVDPVACQRFHDCGSLSSKLQQIMDMKALEISLQSMPGQEKISILFAVCTFGYGCGVIMLSLH
jgi:hypothetical protein